MAKQWWKGEKRKGKKEGFFFFFLNVVFPRARDHLRHITFYLAHSRHDAQVSAV